MTTATVKDTASNDEAAIRALIETVHRAHHAKDAAAIVAAYTPDALVFNLAPPLARHGLDREELPAWLDTWDGPIDREARDFTIHVSGDLAFGHGFYRLGAVNKAAGVPVSLWMRATVGLARTGGAWRIVHEHTSVPFYVDGSFLAATDLQP